jgi:GntR family transcriptional regulator, transcriptional repressor for pyruvate dehydrogenase complex
MTGDLTRALLRPDRGGNAFEQAVERLAEAIRVGALANGERLPSERDLADLMQVSRTTLREALAALRDAGLVQTRRGRVGGTFVVYDGSATMPGRSADLPDIEDVLAFRSVVEPGAAGLAAMRMAGADDPMGVAAALRGLVDAVAQAPDDARRRLADTRLHLAVAQTSGSDALTTAVADVQVRLGQLLAAIPVLPRNIAHSDAQHEAIVAAVLSGRADAARSAMLEHCAGTAALLRGLLG